MNSKNCPSCNEDIGFWAVFKAALPSLIKCPYCKVSLIYKPTAWRMVLVSLIVIIPMITGIIYLMFELFSFSILYKIIVSFGVLTIVWEIFEVYFVIKLRKNYELTLKK